MHAIELVDVAGVMCLGAGALLEDCPQAPSESVVEYWTAARCRLDEWGRSLRQHGADEAPRDSQAFRSLANEIVLSLPHTRSVAALCVLHDARHSSGELASVARNVLAGHAEALERLQPLLDQAGLAGLGEQLQCRAYRWSDLLLGYLLPLCGAPGSHSPEGHVIEFAIDPQRVVDFAFDAGVHSAGGATETQRLLSASLRMSLSGTSGPPANPQLNNRIAGATLGLFGPEAFDDFGLLRSTWTRRLERSTADTLGMVEDLFDERPKPAPVTRRF